MTMDAAALAISSASCHHVAELLAVAGDERGAPGEIEEREGVRHDASANFERAHAPGEQKQ